MKSISEATRIYKIFAQLHKEFSADANEIMIFASAHVLIMERTKINYGTVN